MKLFFACPTYGPLAPSVVQMQRHAMMFASRYAGVEWIGDASPDDSKRSTIDCARNGIVQSCLMAEEQGDAIFWCDADIELQPDSIAKLVREQKEFITGIYHQRYAPHFPVVGSWDDDGKGVNWFIEFPENVVAPADMCGFGCVLTSIAMLKAIEQPHFAFTTLSEDFSFCRKAKEAGFQLFAHTGVLPYHVGFPRRIGPDDFKREWEKRPSVSLTRPGYSAA